MNMHDYAIDEFKKLEKQIASQNRQLETFRGIIATDTRKLDAWKTIIKEYATDEYPGSARLNALIEECIRKHSGSATFQQIIECIEDHQITIPRNKLSILLTKNNAITYHKNEKKWEINSMETQN